ncbi:toxin TcdB middle/N-terminal domain-containing protein, partial [Oryzicola mucosus]
LLRSVKLEAGGVVSVDYTPSSRFENDYLPQVLHAVTKLSVDDGRGGVAATEYAYAGGKYDPKARRFLGYRSVIETRPLAEGETARPVVETTYRQDLASAGLPELVVHKDGAGGARKTIAESYDVNLASRPYWARNVATQTTLSEAGVSSTLRVERVFGSYGNVSEIKDYGRIDADGDETWTERFYTLNTSAYIVSTLRAERVRSGMDETFPYIRYERTYYDGNDTDNSAPPAKGHVTRTQAYAEYSSSWVDSTYEYDGFGNRTAAVDGLGNRTEWDYDTTYNLYPVRERLPRYFANGSLSGDTRFVSQATYDGVCGVPATKTDLNGTVQAFTYDAFCRPYEMTVAATGYYVKTRFENDGNPATQAVVTYQPLPNGAGEVYQRASYDGLGRVWRVETPGETETGSVRYADTRYDGRGNVRLQSQVRFDGDTVRWTSKSYDWANRLVKVVNPDSSERSYEHFLHKGTQYTTNPRLYAVMETDELGRRTGRYSSTRGDVILVIRDYDGLDIRETRSYDAYGRLTRVRDASGSVWTYAYDLLGNRLSATDPDMGTWSYVYDAAGRLISQTDARGAVTTLSYDQMGRLLQKQATPAGGGSSIILATNTYDQAASGSFNVGKLTTSTNAVATHAYRYDRFGKVRRQASTIDGLTHTTLTERDASGQIVSMQYLPGPLDIGSETNPWRYTANNMLTAIPGYCSGLSYEADGQTRSISYANGVKTTFAYSPTRRWLTQVTTAKGTATPLLDNSYTRDLTGRIKEIAALSSGESWKYTYDTAGRLTRAGNVGNNSLDEDFVYAANDNLLSRSRVAGAYVYPSATAARPHAPVSVNGVALTYDANGNMKSDGSRVLTWDAANRLSTVVLNGVTTTLAYGPDGARAKKTSATSTTLYPDASVEMTPGASNTATYVRYPHPDLKIEGTAKTYLHRDHLASVRLVTNSSGALVEGTAYAAYGERLNSGFQTEKGYIGERHDPETGLIYLNA